LSTSPSAHTDPRDRVSVWAEKHRIVPDLGAIPGPWRNEVAPHQVEPMDALSPNDPAERVVIAKPAQSGGSAIAENWLGFIAHRAPGRAAGVISRRPDGGHEADAADWAVVYFDGRGIEMGGTNWSPPSAFT
jgi:hypothetical protein